MRIVITGGHGFVGTALWRELAALGTFGWPGPGRPGEPGEPGESGAIDEIVLLDRASRPTAPATVPVTTLEGDLTDTLVPAFERPVDVLFHLASAVSAECEADLDLGLAVNLEGTRAALEACRAQRESGGPLVRLVFSSSVAVYGADAALPMPDPVTEATLPLPQSSYGAQKLACEALIADYTRRGLLDGRVARLMTVAVRPGAPNRAASGFVSGIIREPLAGVDTVCPVRPDLPLAIASPRTTVAGLLALAQASRGQGLGQLIGRLPVNLPALTVTVGEMLDALERHGGAAARARVTIEPDPAIDAIVRSWPSRFDNARAAALGIAPDADIDAVVAQFVADHLD
ncbi:NAD-dependent epimerase/dehydratase family protein [Piscicoccus intestinalis]|uniref:NAD-dependent epimerase/dehydratase family protein n=1 Tax=Piscicoccus intestinalis TaxID=746033 RepID=UPI0008382E64|nr:NAD-dependent epimerase/dehydratase family protein [Piscicoccus intestinalis]